MRKWDMRRYYKLVFYQIWIT